MSEMDNDRKQEMMRFLISSSILCVLLAAALFYSNEMALPLFGVMAYLFGLLSPLLWFLLGSSVSNERERSSHARISL
jgi:hypothetical protein